MTRKTLAQISLISAILALAACAAPAGFGRQDKAEAPPSCAELAQRKAAEQYQRDSESADQRLGGSIQDSSLRHDLRAMDAAARRQQVYEQCLKLRASPDGQTDDAETPQ